MKTQTEIRFKFGIESEDLYKINRILESTNFFSETEIEVALEVANSAINLGELKSGYNFIFILKNEEIIGFCCFGKIPCTLTNYDIYWLGVSNELRNNNYGSILLCETESIIKSMGASKIFIETSSKDSYLSTRKFYLKNKYKKVAELKNYYCIGDNKIIYEKVILDSYK